MKIKKGRKDMTSDFWYDLTAGGYLVPEKMLQDPKDAKRVREAIETIQEFEESCDKQIKDFYQ